MSDGRTLVANTLLLRPDRVSSPICWLYIADRIIAIISNTVYIKLLKNQCQLVVGLATIYKQYNIQGEHKK